MIEGGLSNFSGHRLLLLQGPVGPFFRRLAHDLTRAGASVQKVNFNGGDWLFFPNRAISFRGRMDAWPAFFERLLAKQHFDAVMLFGDCRPVHQTAIKIAGRREVPIWVFEEGYIRPDFVTMERNGVNGNSSLLQQGTGFGQEAASAPSPMRVRNAFAHAAVWAGLYHLGGTLGRPFFPHYRHHRPLTILELGPWLRSAWRKVLYARKQRGLLERMAGPLSKKFFLVPLQVYNDSQIHSHSGFQSVEQFISYVLRSFAAHAPDWQHLVFKHHPMDRGYSDYTILFGKLAESFGLQNRLLYVHDLHLPTLLRHAIGVVVVNSTVGFSALFHRTPVKVCGQAVYDIQGLTYQGSLDDFWKEAHDTPVKRKLFLQFQNHLIRHTQVNGSFYKRLPVSGYASGLCWD
jgi:capsular polysaccharide export protein